MLKNKIEMAGWYPSLKIKGEVYDD